MIIMQLLFHFLNNRIIVCNRTAIEIKIAYEIRKSDFTQDVKVFGIYSIFCFILLIYKKL